MRCFRRHFYGVCLLSVPDLLPRMDYVFCMFRLQKVTVVQCGAKVKGRRQPEPGRTESIFDNSGGGKNPT